MDPASAHLWKELAPPDALPTLPRAGAPRASPPTRAAAAVKVLWAGFSPSFGLCLGLIVFGSALS